MDRLLSVKVVSFLFFLISPLYPTHLLSRLVRDVVRAEHVPERHLGDVVLLAVGRVLARRLLQPLLLDLVPLLLDPLAVPAQVAVAHQFVACEVGEVSQALLPNHQRWYAKTEVHLDHTHTLHTRFCTYSIWRRYVCSVGAC